MANLGSRNDELILREYEHTICKRVDQRSRRLEVCRRRRDNDGDTSYLHSIAMAFSKAKSS